MRSVGARPRSARGCSPRASPASNAPRRSCAAASPASSRRPAPRRPGSRRPRRRASSRKRRKAPPPRPRWPRRGKPRGDRPIGRGRRTRADPRARRGGTRRGVRRRLGADGDSGQAPSGAPRGARAGPRTQGPGSVGDEKAARPGHAFRARSGRPHGRGQRHRPARRRGSRDDRKIARSGAPSGAARLRVIHGHGTGRLRDAVREHFRRHGSVESLRAADAREGGNGATILELR